MSDYIERESIKYQQIETGGYSGNTWITDYELVAYKRDIESVPAADVREVVRGGWEEHGEPNEHGKYEVWYYACTRCGAVGIPQFNYCPNCGADMREES